MLMSSNNTASSSYQGLKVLLLSLVGALLLLRLVWLYLSAPEQFPINTVRISSAGSHISRNQLQKIIEPYLKDSFFSFKVNALRDELQALDWVGRAHIERIWPDIVKISVDEKEPVAIWNRALITKDGRKFDIDGAHEHLSLPVLQGPEGQESDVLHVYQKLSMILSSVGLKAERLTLSNNQAWVLTLPRGIRVALGKKEIEQRLSRFCRAYPQVFSDRAAQLERVDLRYQHGMAVRWNNHMES